MKRQVIVCDVCGDLNRETASYTIKRGVTVSKSVDLCQEHAEPLESLIAGAERHTPSSLTSSGTTRRRAPRKRPAPTEGRFATLEEIERLKVQG